MRSTFLTLLFALLGSALALGSASLAADEAAAARFYEDAAVRFEAAEYPAAVIQLKNALQQLPTHRPSHILMGRTYLAMGEPGAAEEHLLNARELGADEALIVLPLAEAYLAQRKHQELILNLRYSGYAPNVEYRLRTYQGRAHMALGELDRAAQAYRDAQRLDPMAPEPLAGEASVLLRQGSVELARSKARVAVERAPDSVEAWYALASIHHAVQETDLAIEGYGRVLAIEPEHLEARLARASLYLDLDRDEAAAADLKELRARFPFEVRATYLQSVLLDKQGDAKKSRELLSETAQLLNAVAPEVIAGEAGLQLLGGLANFSLQAYEQAEQFLRRFLASRPQDLGARRMLGAIYLQRRNYLDALSMLEPVLDRTPDDPRVLHMVSQAYVRQGRAGEALPLLERAALSSGGNLAIRIDLALARLSENRPAAALETLRDVMTDAPGQMRAGLAIVPLLLGRGEYEEAVARAAELLEHHPDSLVALNLLATARFQAGERQAAAALFEQIVARDATFLPARINLAKIDIIEGRIDQARSRFMAVLESQPEHVGTMLELARLDAGQGRLDAAAQWVEKALAVRPKHAAATELLVDLHLRRADVQGALRVARAAESWAGENQGVMMALARAHLAAENHDVARAILQRLTTAAGYDTRALLTLAALQRQAGALDDAAWSLRKAVDGDASATDARLQLVAVLINLGRVEEALDAARAMQQAEPGSAASLGALGEALAAAGRHDEALEQFRQALEQRPGDFTAVKYAQALERVGDASVDDWLARWVAEHDEHLAARQMLAERYMRRGENAAARLEYERLLAARPDAPELLNNYALILQRLGDDAQAVAAAERAQAAAPDDPFIGDTLGWLLVESGDPQRGLAYLRDAFSRAGFNPTIRYHIGAALARLDRLTEARKELQAALASPAPFAEREAAQTLLAELGE